MIDPRLKNEKILLLTKIVQSILQDIEKARTLIFHAQQKTEPLTNDPILCDDIEKIKTVNGYFSKLNSLVGELSYIKQDYISALNTLMVAGDNIKKEINECDNDHHNMSISNPIKEPTVNINPDAAKPTEQVPDLSNQMIMNAFQSAEQFMNDSCSGGSYEEDEGASS